MPRSTPLDAPQSALESIQGRRYTRCACGLWVPVNARTLTARCPKCKVDLELDLGGLQTYGRKA
jgi:hypothetical protein